MNRWTTLFAVAGLFLAGGAAQAQDDTEKLKKRILEEVEKRLKAEEERILREVEKIIDEELSRAKRGEKKTHAEKKEEPKTGGRAFFGVKALELSVEERKELGVDAGLRVRSLVEGSPAARILQVGDVLLKVDGRPVEDVETLRVVLGARKAGDSIQVEFLRNKKRDTATVALAAYPEDSPPRKEEGGADPLRERIKKFLDREKREEPKKEEPKKEEKKAEERTDEDWLAFDDETFEQIRTMLEQFGMNPEDYFQKGKDGKWRPAEGLRELLKQFDFRKLLDRNREEDPKKEEKKPEKKTSEPKSKPAWLGVVPGELSDEDRAQLDLEAGVGLAIVEVRPGSPAEKVGVQKGDLLVQIDGKKVKGEESLQKFVLGAKPGQECELTLLRKGEQKKMKVTLAERKD